VVTRRRGAQRCAKRRTVGGRVFAFSHHRIKYVKCPIHIIHGTEDKLIPFKSSIKLAAINSELTRLHSVIGGGHNNLNTFESYHEVLGQILKASAVEFDRENSSIDFKRKTKRYQRL